METSANSARSTSTVTAATGKQTRRATRRAGVGSAETTLICNLTNVRQLWLPHIDSGVTQAAGQSRGGVEILNISVGVGGVIRSARVGPVNPSSEHLCPTGDTEAACQGAVRRARVKNKLDATALSCAQNVNARLGSDSDKRAGF